MTEIINLIIAATVLAVSISACYRSRYWARRAESAAATAKAHKDAVVARSIKSLGQ